MSEYGGDRLFDELTKFGYSPLKVTATNDAGFLVLPGFVVPSGKFGGRIIDLGLQTTSDYPNSVHSSIHVKAEPQLYEPNENVPNVRNVQASPLGPDWRYWSKNFNWSNEKEKTARRLMAKINTIFEHA